MQWPAGPKDVRVPYVCFLDPWVRDRNDRYIVSWSITIYNLTKGGLILVGGFNPFEKY